MLKDMMFDFKLNTLKVCNSKNVSHFLDIELLNVNSNFNSLARTLRLRTYFQTRGSSNLEVDQSFCP